VDPVDLQLDHARRGAPAHDDIVHGVAVENDGAVALHPTLEHRALLVFVFAGHHRRQRFLELLDRNVGDETEAALVDADERRAVASQLAGDAEHRAIAAEHDRDVALLAERVDAERRVRVDAGAACGLRFERDLEALGDEKGAYSLEHLAYAFGLKLTHEGGVSKAVRHPLDYTTATLDVMARQRLGSAPQSVAEKPTPLVCRRVAARFSAGRCAMRSS
jgi:hypothetical protein